MRGIPFGESGKIATRVIVIQLSILALAAVLYKVYIPKIQQARAATVAAERERKIEAFFESAVVEDPSLNVEVPVPGGNPPAHPQKLRVLPTVQEVEQALGAPDKQTTDFRQGLHLTWTGTAQSLEASFAEGRLYNLRLEDLRTAHGVLVFESATSWHPF